MNGNGNFPFIPFSSLIPEQIVLFFRFRTCYTSQLFVSGAGDLLKLESLYPDRYVYFTNTSSYWGIIKIGNNIQSSQHSMMTWPFTPLYTDPIDLKDGDLWLNCLKDPPRYLLTNQAVSRHLLLGLQQCIQLNRVSKLDTTCTIL